MSIRPMSVILGVVILAVIAIVAFNSAIAPNSETEGTSANQTSVDEPTVGGSSSVSDVSEANAEASSEDQESAIVSDSDEDGEIVDAESSPDTESSDEGEGASNNGDNENEISDGEATNGESVANAENIIITDGIKHSVPLHMIIFDDFDQRYGTRSLPFTEATEEDIERLRDRIVPLCHDNPACIEPDYQTAEEAADQWLSPNSTVIGYTAADGQAYAYPFKILNFHEIVNDTLAGEPVAITYCPLCNSALVFSRILDGRELSFGNTSALYESDMVMYDFESGTYWFQSGGEAILGELTEKTLDLLPAVITTFEQWRADNPDSLVLACPRSCTQYIQDVFRGYGDRVNSGRFAFPVSKDVVEDQRLPSGSNVLVIDGEERSVAYPVEELGDAATVDEIDGREIVVLSREQGPTAAAYYTELSDGTKVDLVYEENVWRDQATGSAFNLNGRAVSGALEGQQLAPVPSRFLFWFSAVATTPDIEVFGQVE